MATRICADGDVEANHAVRVVVDGTPVALVRDADGAYYAIGDECSHAEISLAEGFVERQHIECWAHGARFDLTTGQALHLPATEPVAVYDVQVMDGDIYVDVDVRMKEAG